MFVDASLIADVKKAMGTCADDVLFRRLTDAVRLGTNQSKSNDWNIAYMDICVCDGCVTLPADVMTVLAVNVGGHPTLIRDQWFQYHQNGPGTCDYVSCHYTDELGPVVTYKDPSGPVKIVAIIESATDAGVLVRVFGWDADGKRIYTTGTGGILEDGFLVPTTFGFSTPNTEAVPITRIDRVSKGLSNGFIRLVAIDPTDSSVHTQIGYYMPWETVPSYRRLRVPDRSWIRIKYKRGDIAVRGEGDWININNRESLLLLVKAVKFRQDNQLEMARNYELEAMRLLSDESESLRPVTITPPRIIFDADMLHGEMDALFY